MDSAPQGASNASSTSSGPRPTHAPTAQQSALTYPAPIPAPKETVRENAPGCAPVTREQLFDREQSIWVTVRAKETDPLESIEKSDPKLFTSIDRTSASLVQLDSLASVIGGTVTTLGSAALLRSLHHPTRDLSLINARQASIRELEENPKLRQSYHTFLRHFAAQIGEMQDFIGDTWFRSRNRQALERTKAAFKELCAAADKLPEPSTPLLKALSAELRGLPQTGLQALLSETMCTTKIDGERDVIPFSEASLKQKIFDRFGWPAPPKIIGTMAGITLGMTSMMAAIEPRMGVAMLPAFLMMMPMMMLTKRDYDRWNFFEPLARKFYTDPGFIRFCDSAGMLDELLALSSLGKRFPEGGCFPKIVESPKHFMRVRDGHNPTLALSKSASVANDFDLGTTPWALTGPNSGGKTTFAVSACQMQSLAQAGARVPAASAEIAIADRVFYQGQAFNALTDAEGRFGTELQQSKRIFEHSTPLTLRVFDELAQGTTRGESGVHAGNIIRAHDAIGGSVIFITHAFDLVRELASEGTVVAKMISFAGGVPTHRLVEGISERSGADRVAKKIGMDSDAVTKELSSRGFRLKHPLKNFENPAS